MYVDMEKQMTEINLEDFFSHGGSSCSSSNKSYQQMKLSPGKTRLLYGPPGAGKTSLLLQYAFTRASEQYHVLLIMFQKELDQKKPSFVPITPCEACQYPQRSGMDTQYWRNIQIKYVSSLCELQYLICNLQFHSDKKFMLIVDDFDMFFPSERKTSKIIETVALLAELTRNINSKSGCGETLVASTNSSETISPNDLRILSRWCQYLFVIPTEIDGVYSFRETRKLESDRNSSCEMNSLQYQYVAATETFDVLEDFK